MTELSLKEFAESFNSDINIDAQAMESHLEHAFVEKFCEYLVDYGEFESFQPSHWQQRGYKVDAFAFDEDFENLTLIVSLFKDTTDPESSKVRESDLDRVFNQALNFF